MVTKFGFRFLRLLCLVPTFFALPQPRFPGFGYFGPTGGEMKAFFERIKLSNIAATEFAAVNRQIVEESLGIFRKVLNDPKVLQVQTETMNSLTKSLKDFLDQAERPQQGNDPNGVINIVNQYYNIVDNFNSKKQENLSREAAIIERSLTDNGLENMERAVQVQFEAFIVKINVEIDDYIKGLNEIEKENEKDLIDWHRRLNDEQDLNKKIEILKNLPQPNFG